MAFRVDTFIRGPKGDAVKASTRSGLYRWALARVHGERESMPQRAIEKLARRLARPEVDEHADCGDDPCSLCQPGREW